MKVLMKLEVSKKQAYIFGCNKLSENVSRSDDIAYVTSDEYFRNFEYNEENLVYSGGGHSVLQFDSKEKAVNFAKSITENTFKEYNGLELFCKSIVYDENLSSSENFLNLSKELEKKKSFRQSSFKILDFGVENQEDTVEIIRKSKKELGDYTYPNNFGDIAQKEGFVSVIHIDGNAMGKRIETIFEKFGANYEDLRGALSNFSRSVQSDFEQAFLNSVEKCDEKCFDDFGNILIKPVIIAGDDVCLVTKGSIGIEFSRIFLEELAKIENKQDNQKYSACAGVAIVHTKYPFYKAYEIAESLCNSAKEAGAKLDKEGSISAIDWHIEYAQLKNNLSDIREEYICDDGCSLTLRPFVVLNPKKIAVKPYEIYDFFKIMHKEISAKIKYEKIARGKVKELRNALKEGEISTEYFLNQNTINKILYSSIEAVYGDKWIETMIKGKGEIQKDAFVSIENQKYCMYFDAIEMLDVFESLDNEK